MAGGIPQYHYSVLASPEDEIRLIELYPGQLSDDIKISISNIRLHDYDEDLETPDNDRLQILAKTLPPHWTVHESLEKKLVFYYEATVGDKEDWKSSWQHPDPHFDLTPYETVTAQADVQYEALSYTWGSPADPDVAYVVSEEQGQDNAPLSQLAIGQNLSQALRHLRRQDRGRRLWVDAVCINQYDEEEKNAQVTRMSEIYKGAEKVLVWLGFRSADSQLALETLAFIGKQVVMTIDGWNITSPEAEEPDWYLDDYALPYDDQVWAAISSLLYRPWFGRVWVVQEIDLARSAILQCGLNELSWSAFRSSVILLYNKASLPSQVLRSRLDFVHNLVNSIGSDSPIFHSFHRLTVRSCLNPRDFIYGALGLFPSAFRRRIIPQYSLSIGNVYIDFVRSHIEHVKRLELLVKCQLDGRTLHDVPSWVPDYTSEKIVSQCHEWQSASGYSACQVAFRGDRFLDAWGVQRGGVVTVSDPIPDYNIYSYDSMPSASYSDFVAALYRLIRANASEVEEEEENIQDVFARTLTANYLQDVFPGTNASTLELWKAGLRDEALFGGPEAKTEPTFSYQEEYAIRRLLGRTFIRMNDGRIGLGPPGAQKGDIVACLLGCMSPMLLREAAPGSGEFLVVGECFVLELNNSQAFLGPLPTPWRVCFLSDSLHKGPLCRYFNEETDEWSDNDPRMADEQFNDWELEDIPRTGDYPLHFRGFRNSKTGELAVSDPAMVPASLISRDVPLKMFSLI
ncbi:hypothetical protein N0V93_008410 [Gnomoniopsis smithogilvyi]|uniref:Heterokaryon incompatibility domain-containing protein n=1 Tax=Gnomoniopsis smithogilvyi TaxID=1191159 RepID=A0A9W8YMV9_9PEZI|nr:hypothetical protein N0V93_008410 [Gnomoniopsis smithogilvyi]